MSTVLCQIYKNEVADKMERVRVHRIYLVTRETLDTRMFRISDTNKYK